MKFSTLFKCASTGKISSNYISILPQSLTLDPNFEAKYLWKGYQTLFEEIKIIPPEIATSPEMQALFRAKVGSLRMSKSQFLAGLRKKLRNIVFDNWKPGIFHVHVHSSGFDSRMLSWTIKQLHQEQGNAWLGDVMFLCSKWEGSEFKKIMAHEDWKSSQYLVVDEQLKNEEYYAPSLLNFESIWRETNGPSCIPVNLMWYLVERTQKRGLLPQRIQLWTTQWGNTVLDPSSSPQGGRAIERLWKMHYLSQIGTCLKKGFEVTEPFINIDLAQFIVNSSVRMGENLRLALLASMDRKLSQFRNLHLSGDRKQPISREIMQRVAKDYSESWYGRNVKKNIVWKASTDHFPCWSHWTAASLCKHLVKNGYKIKIGNK